MTPRRASDSVAERLKEVRQQRGLSAAALAERCKAIGAPEITRSVIANIESGRRDEDGRRTRDVTVEELLVLAYALQVPPVLLLVPANDTDALQVAAGIGMDTSTASGWLIGSAPAPVPTLLGALARCGSCGQVLWSRMDHRDGQDVPLYYCSNTADPSPVTREVGNVDDFVTAILIARLSGADVTAVADAPKAWASFPPPKRTQLAAILFDRVTLLAADDSSTPFDPDTVQPEWSR